MDGTKKLLILIGATLASAILSVFSRTLMLPVLALTAYMGAVWGAAYLIAPLLASAAAMLIAFGPNISVIPELAALLIAPAFLTLVERKKLPHRYAVLGLAVIFCLGMYLSTALVPMLNGEAPYMGALRDWDAARESLAQALSGFAGAAELDEAMAETASIIPDTLMWICILMGEAFALGMVLILRLWHKAFKTVPRPMAALADWRLPHTAIPGGILMLAAIPVVYILRLEQANAVAYSIGLIVASLFGVQGAAYFAFLFRTTKAPKAVKVLFGVFIALFFPLSLGFLDFFGIKEQITKRRAKITKLLEESRREAEAYSRADELAKYGYVREDRRRAEEKKENNDDDSSGSQADDK